MGPTGDGGFSEGFNRELAAIREQLNCVCTYDVLLLAFLRRVARFGYFTLGPITIDVRMVEDLVERTAVPVESNAAPDDYIRFSTLLMAELRRSGRRRLDELHYLFALMRCNEGLPQRVFGELGITADQLEAHLREWGSQTAPAINLEQLLTPEEVAEYLKVHVQTVRAWVRSGRLPARRVAGLRSLRVRAADVEALLEPLDDLVPSDGAASGT